MAHVVTQSCCGDGSCVFACPVNAIHPTPDEPDFATAEMLYIDPVSCVDCGACVTACPVGAIAPVGKLTEVQLPFVDINALFHEDRRARDEGQSHPPQAPVTPIVPLVRREELRVAIVGSGPAALYAADELLKRRDVQVSVFDRLPTPYGLVRAGVAPDHQSTKQVETLFRQIEDQPGFSYFLNVDIGTTIDHDDLAAHHHAVIYATGASHDRRLDIPGEELPGSSTATAFVAWYNGHPDHAETVFDLSHERVVIVGNGNVALDVARILTTDPDRLASTDIADHALEALRRSAVREVVLLGRRGAAQAAFTLPELVGLAARDDIQIVVEGDSFDRHVTDPMTAQKLAVLQAAAERPTRPDARTIVFRFAASPVQIVGQHAVEAVQYCDNDLVADGTSVRPVATDQLTTLHAGLVLRSIGYRGTPLPGLPFDETAAVVPNDQGRVAGLVGAYVVGWIKRGPSGFIGTNKSCAQETVDHLVADFNAGLLPAPRRSAHSLRALVDSRAAHAVDVDAWRAIDDIERQDGRRTGRPRRKRVSLNDLLDATRHAPAERQGRRRFARR